MNTNATGSSLSLRALQVTSPGTLPMTNPAQRIQQAERLKALTQPNADGTLNIMSKYQADSGTLYNVHVHGL